MFWRSAKAAKKEEDVEESEALVISPGPNGHGSSGNLRGLASPAGDRRKATGTWKPPYAMDPHGCSHGNPLTLARAFWWCAGVTS